MLKFLFSGTLHERWREDFNLDKVSAKNLDGQRQVSLDIASVFNFFFTFSWLKQIYAERDSLMLEDIERLQEETSVREER